MSEQQVIDRTVAAKLEKAARKCDDLARQYAKMAKNSEGTYSQSVALMLEKVARACARAVRETGGEK